ncbi:MAG: methyltransferase domain-containing protein [bacterium]
MTKELQTDIIQWDIKSWSKALDYWEHNIDWSKINNGLELGGKQGGLSLWLALKQKETICSDLNNIKDTAEQLHVRYNITSFVKYQDIDATNIPYENFFDIIVFKSIIGGIGRDNNYKLQKQVFKEIFKALKPGGKLLFAENLAASPVHKLLRKMFIKWGTYWKYITIKEINEFLSDFSSVKIETTGVLGAFGRNEYQRNILSTIDELILNKVCSNNWKYIVYGIAEK